MIEAIALESDGIRLALLALCLIALAEGIGLIQVAQILRRLIRRRR